MNLPGLNPLTIAWFLFVAEGFAVGIYDLVQAYLDFRAAVEDRRRLTLIEGQHALIEAIGCQIAQGLVLAGAVTAILTPMPVAMAVRHEQVLQAFLYLGVELMVQALLWGELIRHLLIDRLKPSEFMRVALARSLPEGEVLVDEASQP